jgi:tetratricopeptide (TPR) repeat protein
MTLAETWRYIGNTEKAAGMRERATESFVRAIEAYPREKASYRMLAELMVSHAMASRRGVEEALRNYHALLHGVQARPAFAHLGACYATLGAARQDLALAEARKMVEAEPDYPELRAILGDLLRLTGELDEARSAYERALSRDPNHPRSRLGLACLAGVRGNRAKVEEHLRETLRRTPWSPQAQQLARILRESGNVTADQFQQFFFVK